MKKANGGKQSFSKLTGSGSGQISARILLEQDPDLFFQTNNRPDPDPSKKWPDPVDHYYMATCNYF